MEDVWIRVLVIILGSVLGSGGFWAFLRHRDTKRQATTKLMMGIAYDTIAVRGLAYLDRGSITRDELQELRKYFYDPYKALGGNGVAERIMNEVSQLPLRSHNQYSQIFRNRDSEGWVNNVRVVTREEQGTPSG